MRINHSRTTRAFTLIELILVMALLTVVISLVTPSLNRFFSGRTLDSEVRQFVSLTRYGQSRAVSEGIPMLLWIDPRAGTYGLKQETGYTDGDDRALQYPLGENLTINFKQGNSKAPVAGKMSGIHFSPDGNVITATSVTGVSIQEGRNPPIWIMQSPDGFKYEVRN